MTKGEDVSVPDIDISEVQWSIVRDILRRNLPNCEVWAFGSRAKRTAKPYSDLDLVLVTHTPLPLALSAKLAEDFSESDLPWKVDVVDWAATGDDFRQVIRRAKVVLLPAVDPKGAGGNKAAPFTH